MYQRGSGILLHPTSLPGRFGIGDLGAAAYRFVDFLVDARQSLWQVLPLGPPGGAHSPYDARSALAGNPLLIALEPLADAGLLEPAELDLAPVGDPVRADFSRAAEVKGELLWRAFERFRRGAGGGLGADFERFSAREGAWLDDYALFAALHNLHHGLAWYEWEPVLVRREPTALGAWSSRLADEIDYHRFCQFLFGRQWSALRGYANERGIRIIGDIPIYVGHDSADVWANQHIFTLDAHGRVTRMAGVPPDLFSATGQLWGNPCYRWDVLARDGYAWWVERVRRSLELVDLVRVDHFRGFQAGWQVPAGEVTAINGHWVPGPGLEFFNRLEVVLGRLPIIVEDLGVITPDVDALRETLGYPGMRVLQFAFGGDSSNPYLPHNYVHDTVVYTGTHDNDTIVGWFRACSAAERAHVQRYLGVSGDDIAWDLIRAALASVGDLAIVPLQDVLELDGASRMNRPGTMAGNWAWRFEHHMLAPWRAERLAELTELYGRARRQ